MKLRLFFLGAAIVAIIAVAVSWYLRNSLVQSLSGPTLDEYGLAISDVSLDALATRDATISYLELVHESGTVIEFRDLTLPFLADEAGVRSYRAARVSVLTSARDDDVPFEIALWVERFLALPRLLAGTDVVIDRFEMPPYLPVSDIHWVLANDTQALSATVEGTALSVAAAGTLASGHELFLSTADAQIGASLERTRTGLSIRGMQSVDLTDWAPLAALIGLVPERIRIDAGGADAGFDISIPFDTAVMPAVDATILATSPWSVVYDGESDDVTMMIAASNDAFAVHATFPDVGWNVRRNRAELIVSAGDWQNIPVTLTEVACESGIRCTMSAALAMSEATLPIGVAAAFEGSAMLDITISGEETEIGIVPGASLQVRELVDDSVVLGTFEAQVVSAATFRPGEDSWSFLADSVDTRVDRLELTDESSGSAAVYLENVSVLGSGGHVRWQGGVYAPSSRVAVPGMAINAPGFSGTVSMDGAAISASLETVGLNRNGTIEALHDKDSGVGRLSLREAGLSFGRRTLAQRFSPWPYSWSFSAGTTTLSMDADWRLQDSDLSATSTVRFADLAGFYNDIAFTGLTTTLEGAYASKTGFAIEPAELTLALVDLGLPVENISARYRLDANALAVDVESLRMEAFDGVIRADPFSFRTAAERNNLVLNFEGMNLVELLSMQEFEAISIAGRIDAVIPVAIVGNRIIVEGGTLAGVAPGGRIRYNPGAGNEPQSDSGIGLATMALSNFEFDSLSSAVDYGENGDLKLQMKLSGRNPDLDSQRPVVLNLGVETNVPQMLRSLQAARTVEDIIKKQAER